MKGKTLYVFPFVEFSCPFWTSGCDWEDSIKQDLSVCPEVFLELAPKFFFTETCYTVRGTFGTVRDRAGFYGKKTIWVESIKNGQKLPKSRVFTYFKKIMSLSGNGVKWC